MRILTLKWYQQLVFYTNPVVWIGTLTEWLISVDHHSVVQSSLDYLEHNFKEHVKYADGCYANQPVERQLVYDGVYEWIRLQSRFYSSHTNDEPLVKLEDIESDAARLLLKRLADGELYGTNPIRFFESAVERLGDSRPQAFLSEHIKSIVTAGEDGDSYEFNNARWDYLQPRSRSEIWRVIVRGALIHFAQRYGFTDIQDVGEKGILPARVSMIACGLLARLEVDCLTGTLAQPLSTDEIDSAIVADESSLRIELENGILQRGGKSIETPNRKALRVLQVLYDNLEGQVSTAALKDRIWGVESDVTNDAVRKQVNTAASLLGEVTDVFAIKRDGLSGWRMYRT